MDNLTILPVSHPTGSYDIYIGRNLLHALPKLLSYEGVGYAIITDTNVGALYGDLIPNPITTLTLPAGEGHKTLATVQTCYAPLLASGLDRKGEIIALGGGVVGDMAGFVAATFMRGVAFVQCPTTLLSMVDASVGGKTGVDLPEGKNLVGAFKQPKAVVIDLDVLQTLPPIEFSSGLAEAIKHGLIGDRSLFGRFEQWEVSPDQPILSQLSAEELHELVVTAVEVKRVIVQEDPFEKGKRAWLNLGHTFGHAIEQVSQYEVLHGHGVAMGLLCAADLSVALGYCSAELPTRIEAILKKVNLPTRIPAHLPSTAMLTAMQTDKKKEKGSIRFVLLRDIGDCFLSDGVPLSLAQQIIESRQIIETPQ